MSHTSRFRFKKRIVKRHQSSRRKAFYSDVHDDEAKPFMRCDEGKKKAAS